MNKSLSKRSDSNLVLLKYFFSDDPKLSNNFHQSNKGIDYKIFKLFSTTACG